MNELMYEWVLILFYSSFQSYLYTIIIISTFWSIWFENLTAVGYNIIILFCFVLHFFFTLHSWISIRKTICICAWSCCITCICEKITKIPELPWPSQRGITTALQRSASVVVISQKRALLHNSHRTAWVTRAVWIPQLSLTDFSDGSNLALEPLL